MYVQESKGKAREPEAAVKQRISVSVLFCLKILFIIIKLLHSNKKITLTKYEISHTIIKF
jgi:hypothetical protein